MPTNLIEDRENCDIGAPAAAQPLPPGVTPGAIVRVRGSRWLLDAVVTRADCRELHLQGGHPPGRRVLLWPFDRPNALDPRPRVTSVRLWAWAASVGAAVAADTDPLTPRGRARHIRILPYQLAPAVAMAAGASRLLLADEVGLGKTIQAGWIVADLLAREHGARILVAVPAGLRRQWRGELEAGFGVAAVPVDARWLRDRVADVPADVSPWAAPGVYLGSIDFLKRPDVAASLETQIWDLLIVDEAHTATAPTERYAALAAIAARARRVVAITATPYSGDTAGFTSMAGLGAVDGSPPLMFRRSREDVGDPRRRRHRFAAVRITRREGRLQRLLEHYSRLVWRNAPGDVEGARLAVTILRKRALSSPSSAARSLRRRLELLLVEDRASMPRQLSLFDEEDEAGDEPSDAALAAPGLPDAVSEQRWLARLIEAADEAAGEDSKERYLRRLLDRAGGEPVIVFTEYRDTLLQLASALPPSLRLHGGLTARERADVQERFNTTGGLLLATDAAAEGLNLQRRCRLVVNYELPWNPARLEQRIGRIDRIGQERPVHAITLVARDTAEDLVIANLARRLARVVATLGEQDRLGAFLTDARTARLVIAGATPDELLPVQEPPAVVNRAPAVGEEARRAADRLILHVRRDDGHERWRRKRTDIVVSTLRASADLPAGLVIVIDCAARAGDGDLAASRVLVLHAAADAARPRTRRAARAIAAEAIGSLPDLHQSFPEIAAWFARAASVHVASIDRRLAREKALCGRLAANTPVQPGLFDRRALRTAEDLSALGRVVRAEYGLGIAALERSRVLHLSATPIAVLIVWH